MMPSSSGSSSSSRRMGAGCRGRLRFHLASVLIVAATMAAVAVAAAGSSWTQTYKTAAFLPPLRTSAQQQSTRTSTSRGRGNQRMLLAYPKDVRPQIKVGDLVIPVARSWSGQPPQLVALGLYVGIEYRVLGIAVVQDEEEGQGQGSASVPVTRLSSIGEEELGRVRVTLRPRYRLTKRYDRPWPIEVAFADLPTLLYPTMYNALTLGLTLALSSSFLLAGALGRAFVLLVYVPSLSMAPSIQSGDLLLVEEVSKYFLPLRRGDIVAFRPPPTLKALIAARASQAAEKEAATKQPPLSAELFVKRVGCLAGDTAVLQEDRLLCSNPNQAQLLEPPKVYTGTPSAAIAAAVGANTDDDKDSLMRPKDLSIPEGFYVVGDNPDVSIDSRVWGVVPKDHIVGRAMWRLLPLSRFGPLDQ